ncbi:MAG: hypothetical protein V4683_07235 [Bacteroidota bacterium]
MKRNILIFTSILLLSSLSCSKSKKSDPAACSNNASGEYSAALTAFTSDPTNKIKCQAYITAVGKLVNCPGVTADVKAAYEASVQDNPCNGL